MDHAHASDTSLPDGFRLLPGEELAYVEKFSVSTKQSAPSSTQALFRLTSSSHASEVGMSGPALAALAHSDHDIPAHQGLYSVVFGRDSLRVAIDLVRIYPLLARNTVLDLAKTQGTTVNTAREEEPGRIVHEVRDPDDPIARELTLTRGWGWPYYGTVDATLEFIRTLSAYCRLSDDNMSFLFEPYYNKDGKKRVIADALVAAVGWMLYKMKQNPEGLIEFKAAIPKGIENQVWKDSWDAYHHADGEVANHAQGIASIEVQTVAYDALLDAADLYDNLGKRSSAGKLRRKAKQLSTTVLQLFWTEDKGGYFVLGTDRDDDGHIRQLKVRASNMGHVLNSRIIEGEDAEHKRKRNAIIRQLASPEMLTTSGIRTLASDEVRYREGAYHNGSVWIWDTHHIAKGIRRHNVEPEFAGLANSLDDRILAVVDTIGGFPEYVRGGSEIAVNTHIIDVRDPSGRINRIEQPPQEVQGWTVAAIRATRARRTRQSHLSSLDI